MTIFLFFTPSFSQASELIHTLQTASFTNEKDALSHYDSVAEKLNGKELDFLRIEKVGKFYSIRLGKFEDHAAIRKFLTSIKRRISSAVIMKAYIEDDRIVRMHPGTASRGQPEAPEEPRSAPEAEEAGTEPPMIITESAAEQHQKKGDAYWEIDRYFLAMQEYQQALQSGLKTPEIYWKRAKVLYITGFLNEAVHELERAVTLKPDIDVFRIDLGILYIADNQIEKAKDQFIAALEINPSLTQVYIYLGELSFRTGDYNMAWFSARMAAHLGHESENLTDRLQAVSKEPVIKPLESGRDNIYLRQILVSSRKKAETILNRMSGGELFELIAGTESKGPNALKGGYIGNIHSSELHPGIVNALMEREVFAPPVIVETENGFHIIQRVAPFDFDSVKKSLTHTHAAGKSE